MVLRGLRERFHKHRLRHSSADSSTLESGRSSQQSQSNQNQPNSCVAAPDSPKDLWQEAFDKLDQPARDKLCSIRNADGGLHARPEELLQSIVQTTQRQYDEDEKRNGESKTRQLRVYAHKTLSAALSFQSVISAAAACDPTGHATTAWTFVSLALTMAKNRHDLREAAFESSGFIADTLERYAVVEMYCRRSVNTDTQVPLERLFIDTYVAILKYTAEMVTVRQANVGRMLLLSITPLKDQPLSTLKSAIAEQDKQLDSWMRLDQYRRRDEEAEKLLTQIDVIAADVQSLIQDFEVAKLVVADGAAYDSYANQLNEGCLENTRTGLLRRIMAWAESPDEKCIFWLNGMAGTGKSTISKSVARKLQDKNYLGASFFFKRGEADRGNASRFFATIVEQLIVHEPRLIPHVRKAIQRDSKIAAKGLVQQFDELLLKPLLALNDDLPQHSVLVLVIDALDECDKIEDVQQLISLLPRIQDSKAVRLRVFITSRPEFVINTGFRKLSRDDHDDVALHEIPAETVEQDISVFIRDRLLQIRKERQSPSDDVYNWADEDDDLSNWPEESEIAQLIQIAIPLFISAATICRFIEDPLKDPRDRLRIILENQPASHISMLGKTYLPVFSSILAFEDKSEHAQTVSDFKRLIGPIIILASPLSVSALACLLDIPKSTIGRHLSFLTSVVSVPKDKDQPVRPYHSSFRDFLLAADTREETPFWVDGEAMHRHVAFCCIRVMERSRTGLRKNLCNLPNYGTLRSEINRESCRQYIPAELKYACRYWIHHLQQGKIALRDGDEAHRLLEKHFLHWFEAMSILGLISEVVVNINILRKLPEVQNETLLSGFLYDAHRFILKNLGIAEKAPLQLYASALVFAPQKSPIRNKFARHIPPCISRLPNVGLKWGPSLQSYEGHNGRFIIGVACSPDGEVIASMDKIGTIILWSTLTGTIRQSFRVIDDKDNLPEIEPGNSKLTFSPDGRLLASVFKKESGIQLWKASTGILHGGIPNHLRCHDRPAFTPDSTAVLVQDISTKPHTLGLWSIAQRTFHQTLEGQIDGLLASAISHDGQMIATGSDTGILRLWNTAMSMKVQSQIKMSGGSIKSLAFSPHDDLLASCSYPGGVKVWNVKDGSLVHSFEDLHPISVAFSYNGEFVASCGWFGTAKLWNSASGKLEHNLNRVHTFAFSPNGELVSDWGDGIVRLWDLRIGDQNSTALSHTSSFLSIHLLPCGSNLVLLITLDGATLWDFSTGTPQHQLEALKDPIFSPKFSGDGRLIAAFVGDTIKVWDTGSGKLVRVLEMDVDDSDIECYASIKAAFRPDGKIITWALDTLQFQVWDPVSGKQTEAFNGSIELRSFVVSHDGRLLAVNDTRKNVSIREISTGKSFYLKKSYDSCMRMAFSPNDMILVILSLKSCGKLTMDLWDLPACELHSSVDDVTGRYIHFSENGKYVSTVHELYNLETDTEGHLISISAVNDRIKVDGDGWVCLGKDKVLWLPEEYRAVDNFQGFCVKDSTLMLGSHSDRLLFIGFDMHAKRDA
ncbi:hypothetical protein CBS63078_2983 [Aspergillus niger]|nr:hypothetical protein CBS12448_3989 [Aspergillus niger]KAI2915540.1 hypothetical protein CBS147371_5825 [Aspergillus niger]KAI2918421.1 hypothetical protein CBS63078_2983 [Aspergillus niger]KAI2933712.1 hypothetical protein CBS147320_1568 [Aspergillus niger]KAI2957399.1 hypothetical protein CBS147324_10732 [Aspergillus niger]